MFCLTSLLSLLLWEMTATGSLSLVAAAVSGGPLIIDQPNDGFANDEERNRFNNRIPTEEEWRKWTSYEHLWGNSQQFCIDSRSVHLVFCGRFLRTTMSRTATPNMTCTTSTAMSRPGSTCVPQKMTEMNSLSVRTTSGQSRRSASQKKGDRKLCCSH